MPNRVEPHAASCDRRAPPSGGLRHAPTVAHAIAAFAVAITLTACAYMDRAPAPLGTIDVDNLGAKASATDWPREDWWRRYGDAQLDALVAEGLASSPSLAAAQSRIARAAAAAGVARSALFPQLGSAGDITHQRYSENSVFPPPFAGSWDTDSRLTLDFAYEIDFWNKNGAALQSALSQTQAVAADAQATRVLLTTNVARAYFNLQRLFAQREVSRAAIAQREEVVRITSQRFSAGLDTKVEVRQADAALATVRTELAQYDDAVAIARHQIAALLGAGPERGAAIVAIGTARVPGTELPAVVPLDIISRRPEIVASRWRIEAAGQDIELAKAMFYPNVNLIAFAHHLGNDPAGQVFALIAIVLAAVEASVALAIFFALFRVMGRRASIDEASSLRG